MPEPGPFDAVFSRGRAAAEVSGDAWLRAMLDVESALAAAQADVGLVPYDAARAIAAAAADLASARGSDAGAVGPGRPSDGGDRARHDQDGEPEPAALDVGAVAAAASRTGTPVAGVVAQLRERVGEPHARFVHYGATSQDIQDTAAMLVTGRAVATIRADLVAAGDACADLAERHRDTIMAGRTLLQQAVPVTFGLKAAGWLAALDASVIRLDQLTGSVLAAQYGGAAGTLDALGDDGPAVLQALAEQLGLAAPAVPWHGDRTRIAETGSVLGIVAGTCSKIGTDIVLLAQTEVGEITEAAGTGVPPGDVARGGSTAMPHKSNPVAAVAARACAQRTPGLVATLLAAMAGEHERAAGSWHAEWETLADLLRLTGSAAGWLLESVCGLTVDADRMRANLAKPLRDGTVGSAGALVDRTVESWRSTAHDS